FQRGIAARVEAQPFGGVSIDGHARAQGVVARREGQYFAACLVHFSPLHEANRLRGEVDLHNAVAEEIDSQQAVDMLVAGATRPAQIHGKQRGWDRDAAGVRGEAFNTISDVPAVDALHVLASAEFEPEPLRRT